MISKEQWNEIITKYIPKKGTFVEIGAYDGESYSNTSFLADDGWRGYYFEPVIEYAMQCVNRHRENKVYVIPIAIGKPGIKTFFVNGMLSTLNPKTYQQKVLELEWFSEQKTRFRPRKVYVAHPRILPECDVLVVDVEGAEDFIVKKMKITPKIIMVELHEKSPDWQRIIDTRKTSEFLEDKGYVKVYSDDVDSVFVYGI